MTLAIDSTDAGVLISVKVVPGASRSRIAGILGTALKVNIAAAPEKGKANSQLIDLLSRALGIAARQITITSGHRSPRKQVLLEHVTPQDLRKKLDRHIL